MFSNFANKSTGTRVANIIITPPIVGVPAFCTCPIKPKSLTVSPICCFLKKLMIFFPNMVEINNERINAIAARNVIN